MKIPKNLEEKRNELAKDHGSYIARMLYCGDQYPRPMYSRLDFRCGFDSACDLLLPEIKRLEEALEWYATKGEGAYSDAKLYLRAESALKSLREFLGEL